MTTNVIPTTAIQHIALSKLGPSKANARRVNATAGVSELADSIEAHGLIQNLTVRKAAKGGKFEVVAGARRLAALRLLVKEGVLEKDTEIPCNVLGAALDAEISLAENTQRTPMHVVDEVTGYRQLVERGLSPGEIASRFGQSVVTVRQRLKLASLSPRILDAMRVDEINLEQAKALAISDDHVAQEAAWFDREGWYRNPQNIRAALTDRHVRSGDKLTRFVGLENYEAAGGAVLRDLFGESSTTFLIDRPLLVKLATAKLEAAAEAIQSEGWSWITTGLDATDNHNGLLGRIHPTRRALKEEEWAELTALTNLHDDLAERIESHAEDDPQIGADEIELAGIEQRIEEIKAQTNSYDPCEKALAGSIVGIGYDGALQITRGLVKAEDRKALDKLGAAAGGEDEGCADSNAPTLSDAAKDEDDGGGICGYSEVLIEELTAIRTAALRVELASRPEVALAAILHPLLIREFFDRGGHSRMDSAVEVSGERRNLDAAIKVPEACRALTTWKDLMDGWGHRLPGDLAHVWDWLIEQPTDILMDLLSVVTAANLNAVTGKYDMSRQRIVQADQIAQAVELDMRGWWSPEREFLTRIPKMAIAGIMRQAGCAEVAAKAIERAKKDDAVAQAERALDGKGWLPAPLLMPTQRKDGKADLEMLSEPTSEADAMPMQQAAE